MNNWRQKLALYIGANEFLAPILLQKGHMMNYWRQKLRVKDGWRQFQNWRQFFKVHPSEPPKAGAKKSFGAKKTGAKSRFGAGIFYWR